MRNSCKGLLRLLQNLMDRAGQAVIKDLNPVCFEPDQDSCTARLVETEGQVIDSLCQSTDSRFSHCKTTTANL